MAFYTLISFSCKEQMKNLFCRELLAQHVIPLDIMKKKWNKECPNKQTLSGYPIYLFNNLKTLDNTYCVRPDELAFFQNKHPYTGTERAPSKFQLTLPITQEFNHTLCPLAPLRADEHFVFLVSVNPISVVEQLPARIPLIRQWNASYSTLVKKKVFVLLTLRPSNIYSFYYYVMKVNKINPKTVSRDEIVRLFPLYDKKVSLTMYDKIYDPEMKDALKKYFSYSSQIFSDDMLTRFRELCLRLPEPIKAFRGVLIHSWEELHKAKLDHLTTGDTWIMDSRGFPLSWSTDSCISQYFATHAPARPLSRDSQLQFGVLYSCVLQPDQIAIDTRLIDRPYFFKQLYWYDQQEIITFPYLVNEEMNRFQCKVERLFLVKQQKGERTIVHSFKKIIPLLRTNKII